MTARDVIFTIAEVVACLCVIVIWLCWLLWASVEDDEPELADPEPIVVRPYDWAIDGDGHSGRLYGDSGWFVDYAFIRR